MVLAGPVFLIVMGKLLSLCGLGTKMRLVILLI